jgi:hypothetical protein
MSTTDPIPADVARLICGNVDDLKCYLRDCTDVALIERAITWCDRFENMHTKRQMLQRHQRRLGRNNSDVGPAGAGATQQEK